MAKKAIVTGACGFIGSALVSRLLHDGFDVVGIDNLSRRGSELNWAELSGKGLHLFRVDISNTEKCEEVFRRCGPVDCVFHLAAQVAVTTSYINRRNDFLDNAVATFNVLECIKTHTPGAFCLYSSTNKVYGHIEVHTPVGLDFPLNPYTPYGVSKATGELYFTEFGRPELGLKTVSFRQSCIYGHHQYGVEDQGWVAWFAIANLLGVPLTIYGDGNQVRDLLFVDDLVNLYMVAMGQGLTGVYPVGGGTENALSIKEGIALIEQITGTRYSSISYADVRAGDQPYFVADLSWSKQACVDWGPSVGVTEGITRMVEWIGSHMADIKMVLAL